MIARIRKDGRIGGALLIGASVVLVVLSNLVQQSGPPATAAVSTGPSTLPAPTVNASMTTTATQATADAPKTQPIAYAGDGKRVAGPFTLRAGLARIAWAHKGQGYFFIKMMDDQGQNDALVANKFGIVDGETAISVKTPGAYVLDITADGAWSVSILQ